jgi:hypothetical protein
MKLVRQAEKRTGWHTVGRRSWMRGYWMTCTWRRVYWVTTLMYCETFRQCQRYAGIRRYTKGFCCSDGLNLISSFRRGVDEICDSLGIYTASCDNYLPTFRDNVSVSSSRVKIKGFLSYLESWPVKMGPIRCPETSVNNYHTTPCNYPEDHGLTSVYMWQVLSQNTHCFKICHSGVLFAQNYDEMRLNTTTFNLFTEQHVSTV